MSLVAVGTDSAAFAELQEWLEDEGLATTDLQESDPRFFRIAGPDGLTQGVAGIAGEGPERPTALGCDQSQPARIRNRRAPPG